MTDAARFQYHDLSVPQAYDQFFEPRFALWAELLVKAADVRVGDAVVDVATGPGTVARVAAARTGSGGRVVGADISLPMLEIARSKPAAPGSAPITYIQSPAAPLAVESGSFDRVLCQQGFQFFPDRVAAAGEMRRALKPRGVAAIAVLCEIERNPFIKVFRDVLKAVVSAETAELLNVPFSLPRGAALAEAMQAAGFDDVRVSTEVQTFTLELEEAVAAFAAIPVSVHVKQLPADHQQEFREALRREFEHMLRNGLVVAESTSNIAVGMAL